MGATNKATTHNDTNQLYISVVSFSVSYFQHYIPYVVVILAFVSSFSMDTCVQVNKKKRARSTSLRFVQTESQKASQSHKVGLESKCAVRTPIFVFTKLVRGPRFTGFGRFDNKGLIVLELVPNLEINYGKVS